MAGRVSSGFSWLRIGTSGGLLWNGDEPSGSGATELAVWPVHDEHAHSDVITKAVTKFVWNIFKCIQFKTFQAAVHLSGRAKWTIAKTSGKYV
jgi:hypothetical protein